MEIQELVHPKEKPLNPYFLLKNTKGDVFKNVQAALLHAIKINGHESTIKKVHMICTLYYFISLLKTYDSFVLGTD